MALSDDHPVTRPVQVAPLYRCCLARLYAALADPAGVLAHRRGAFERIEWILTDWDSAQAKLVDIEARDGRGPSRTGADRAGLLDRRTVRGRCRGDPGPDGGPAPVQVRDTGNLGERVDADAWSNAARQVPKSETRCSIGNGRCSA
ncbi:MAG: hypothetical protein WCG47_08710 [Dermatophilaceae bacterium]